MTTYSIEKLSGSTDGKGVKVTGTTAGAATTVHTATSGSGDIDLITLYVANQNTNLATRTVTFGWGGHTDPDNLVTVNIPAKSGFVLVCERAPLMNSLVLDAWADAANDVMVYGTVTRVDKP